MTKPSVRRKKRRERAAMAALLEKEKIMSTPVNPGQTGQAPANVVSQEAMLLAFATKIESTVATLAVAMTNITELVTRLDAKIDAAIQSFGGTMPNPAEVPATVASTVVSAAPIPDAVHSPKPEMPISMIREIEVRTKAPLHPVIVNGFRMCMFGFLGQLVAVTFGAVAAAPLAAGALVGIILGFGGDRIWAWGRYLFNNRFIAEETTTTKQVVKAPLAA